MRTVAVINLKGGVAKTITSNSIAYILANQGYRVLLLDNDKQGDASRGLNRRTQDGEGIDRIMTTRHPEDWMHKLIKKTDFENLDVLPAYSKSDGHAGSDTPAAVSYQERTRMCQGSV